MSTSSRHRVRRKGGLIPASIMIRSWNEPPALPPVDVTNNYSLSLTGTLEVMHDVVTPNFKVLRSNGTIVNSPMSRSLDFWDYGDVNVHCVQTLNTVNPAAQGHTFADFNGSVGVYPEAQSILEEFQIPSIPDVVSMSSQLRVGIDVDKYRFLAAVNARNKVSPVFVQSIVSLAEMHKTIGMIANVARTLARLRQAISRNASIDDIYHILGGKFSVAKVKRKIVDPVYNRWLEYRYGWTPLIMELQGALKALDPARIKKIRATARGKAKASKDETWTRNYKFADPNFGTNDYLFQQLTTVECRAFVLFEADLQFQTARDFGLTEIPLAMWELVPYSFVVDWFLPIGDWLEAITPKLGVKVLAEGITSKRDRLLSRTVTGWNPSTSASQRYDQSGFINTLDRRRKLEIDRVPSLGRALAYPKFNVKINVKRALDAIALLGIGSKPSVRI